MKLLLLAFLVALVPLSEAGNAVTRFLTFDYENGDLDSVWWNGAIASPQLPKAQVKNGLMCSDTQSLALYIGNGYSGTSGPTTLNTQFRASSSDGFETYVLALAAGTIDPDVPLDVPHTVIYTIGLDGGNTPALSIKPANGTTSLPSATGVPVTGLQTGAWYRIWAFVTSNYISVELRNATGFLLASNFLTLQGNNIAFDHYGVLTGRRADGFDTCVQYYSIKTTDVVEADVSTGASFFGVAASMFSPPMPTFNAAGACGTTQSVAILNNDAFSGTARVSSVWSASTTAGFETGHFAFGLHTQDSDLLVGDEFFMLAGLDGGNSPPTLYIANITNFVKTNLAVTTLPAALVANTKYHLVTFWSQFGVVAEVRVDGSASVLARVSLSSAALTYSPTYHVGSPWQQFGFIVGRGGGATTCVKAFNVETSFTPNTNVIFEDNFNRPDAGTLGVDYSAIGAQTEPSVRLNEACGEAQNAAFYSEQINTPWTAEYYWTAFDRADWESYHYSADTLTDQHSLLFSGVDGGDDHLRFTYALDGSQPPDGTFTAKQSLVGTGYTQAPGLYYRAHAYSGGRYHVLDLMSFDERIIGSYTYFNPTDMNLHFAGLMMGRSTDSSNTCVDNYLVQTQPVNPTPANQNGGGPTCGVSPAGGSGKTRVLYFDYDDGAPDSQFWEAFPTSDPLVQPMVVSNKQFCGTDHNVAFFIGDGRTTGTCGPVTIDMPFQFDSLQAIEAYILAYASPTFPATGQLDVLSIQTPIYVVGIDGGNASPQLAIHAVNQSVINGFTLPATQSPQLTQYTFQINTPYRLRAVFTDNTISLELREGTGAKIASQWLDITGYNLQFRYYGMVLGRQNHHTCTPSFTIKSMSSDTDTFDRVELGNNWAFPESARAFDAQPAGIVGGAVCADSQSLAIWQTSYDLQNGGALRFAFTLTAANLDGFEANIIMSTAASYGADGSAITSDPELTIAGLDGGGRTLRITKPFQDVKLAESAQLNSLTPGVKYQIVVFVSQYGIDVSLADPSTPGSEPVRITASLRAFSAGVSNRFHTFGFITGRKYDGALTCFDNWSVQYNIEPQNAAITDNFNSRATLGTGYVPNFFGNPALVKNEVCADTQAVAMRVENYTEPVSVDFYYTAEVATDWESYIIATADYTATQFGYEGVDSGSELRIRYNTNQAPTVLLNNAPYSSIFTKTNGTYFHLFGFASSTILAIELRTFDDRVIASQVYDIRTLGFAFRNFGLLVGRQNNGYLTCADNLFVQRQPRNPESDNGGQNGATAVRVSMVAVVAVSMLLAALAF